MILDPFRLGLLGGALVLTGGFAEFYSAYRRLVCVITGVKLNANKQNSSIMPTTFGTAYAY